MATPRLEALAGSTHRHHWLLGVATVLGMSLGGAADTAPVAHSSAAEPRITFVGDVPEQARTLIDWAVERFVTAGLQLPNLEISFPHFCSGKRALYRASHGQHFIDFCRLAPRTVLHEFAHAWDDASGVVDRDAFLRLRGLTVWFGGLDTPSVVQGAEHLAEIVAWGLSDPARRSIPMLAKNSVDELTEAFTLLTSQPPLA